MRIQEVLKEKRESGSKELGFIPYFIGGYPDLETSFELIEAASEYADVIEIGIPYTDPIADGVVIQRGVSHVLNLDINLDMILKRTMELRKRVSTPLIYMLYFNQVYAYGKERFVKKLKEAGVDGLIVPDLLVGCEPEFNILCEEEGIELIFFVSLTTSDKRIEEVVKSSKGFIYLIGSLGVTGERDRLGSKEIRKVVDKIVAVSSREGIELPIYVGFGISKPEHKEEVSKYADGVIVGSALVVEITKNIGSKEKCIYNTLKKIRYIAGR